MRTLPVNLLVDGRPCLVVGAGKVAGRKAAQLREAGAVVTVIGETAGEGVRGLQEEGEVRLIERAFAEDDVNGMFVVLAATNDAAANLGVLEACRRRGIPCGCVDFHWRESDLISPAVLRLEDVTVSVSTGGQSCRRSRLVRDSLARHLSAANAADLVVIGTSHLQIPLSRIEPFHLRGGALAETGRLLRGVWGLHEFLVMSTCNRVELLALATDDAAVHELARRAAGFGALAPADGYIRRGFDAFEHACLLTAGLLSQSPGETHIVAQVKDALEFAQQNGWAGGIAGEWVSAALHVSKEIRAATAGAVRGADVEDLILQYLDAGRPGFAGMTGVLIGTGTVGCRLAEQIMARGGGGTLYWVYHSRKPEVRAEWQDRVVPVAPEVLASRLAGADYVIAATGGSEPVLQAGHAAAFAAGREVLVVDAGMPRNVDPGLAARAPGIRLVGLDDLSRASASAASGVVAAVQTGRRIVEEHRSTYERILQGIRGSPPAA